VTYYAPGTYECEIVNHGIGVSDKKKTPFIWLEVKPLRTGDTAVAGEYTRMVNLYLTEKTSKRVVEQLRSLGWDGDSFRSLENGSYSFAGTKAEFECSHEPYDGKQYERWNFPAPKQTTPEAVTGAGKRLDALFGAALKAVPKKPKPTPPEPEPVREPNAANGEVPDDEIPF